MGSGDMVRSLRQRSGLSQVELAGRGIAASVLSAYEHGRRQPGADVFLALIRAAGYQPTFIRRFDDRVQGRRLADVLDLAEALPFRPRPMPRARLTA